MEHENSIQNKLLKLYGTAQLPIRVEKPWGYEIVWAATEEYVGKILHVNKGAELSLQYHLKKKETNRLLTGRMILVKGKNLLRETTTNDLRIVNTTITPGHTWTNEPGDVHTIIGVEESDVVEVSTSEIEDVVRIKDNYGREGTDKP